MISSLISVLKVKIKYSINIVFDNTKRNIFNKKAETLDYDNIINYAIKAFFYYFSIYFLLTFFLFLMGICMPINIFNQMNMNTLSLLIFFIGISNTFLVSPINSFSEDTLYCIEYLKIPIKKYILSNYIIQIIKKVMMLFFVISSFVFLLSYDFLSSENILFLIFLYFSGINIGILTNLLLYKNKKSKYIMSTVLYFISYSTLFLNFSFDKTEAYIIFLMLILLNVVISKKIFDYQKYKDFYLYIFDKYKRKKVKLKSYEFRKASNSIMDINVNKIANPYKNFINIFDKRYKNVLPKKFTIGSVIILLITVSMAFSIIQYDSMKEYIYYNVYYNLTFFAFILCFMNSSRIIIEEFYKKCDIKMNAHNFYNCKKIAIKMYYEKFKYIILNDLFKTNVLAGSLILLYSISGFTISFFEYIYIIIIINCIMILLTLYYLSMYYFKNPYKNGQENKKFINLFIIYLPYYITFQLSGIFLTIYDFGVIIIIVTIISLGFNHLLIRRKYN